MTQEQWLASNSSREMVEWLRGTVRGVTCDNPTIDAGKRVASDRKLRLFACAVSRQSWHLLNYDCTRRAVQVAERFADELATQEELSQAFVAATRVFDHDSKVTDDEAGMCCHAEACEAACYHVLPNPGLPLDVQARLLREVVGNPFCSLPAVWNKAPVSTYGASPDVPPFYVWPAVSWLTPTVLDLAQAAYEDRPGSKCKLCQGTSKKLSPVYGDGLWSNTAVEPVRYSPVTNSPCPECWGAGRVENGALDAARLAVLSDALEEAGCTEESLLAHLRSPGPHVRGCWALDCVLGKE